jgi:hypothetical protein
MSPEVFCRLKVRESESDAIIIEVEWKDVGLTEILEVALGGIAKTGSRENESEI